MTYHEAAKKVWEAVSENIIQAVSLPNFGKLYTHCPDPEIRWFSINLVSDLEQEHEWHKVYEISVQSTNRGRCPAIMVYKPLLFWDPPAEEDEEIACVRYSKASFEEAVAEVVDTIKKDIYAYWEEIFEYTEVIK